MNSLDIEQIAEIADYNKLKQQIYTEYGMEIIFSKNLTNISAKSFPEPLNLILELSPNSLSSPSLGLIHHLSHEITRSILNVTREVLKKEYAGNPIFSGSIDRETLAQIVSRIYNALHLNDNISTDQILRALINLVVLNELLGS